MDRDPQLLSRAQPGLVGVRLLRGQSSGHARQGELSHQRPGLSVAHAPRPAGPGPEILQAAGEEVTAAGTVMPRRRSRPVIALAAASSFSMSLGVAGAGAA